MFLPISSDAPLYYRPIGTILLILANCIVFGITAGGDISQGWILRFGDGLHPTEWVTSAFLHFGATHLIGNMIFLWSFGLVVEGKLGFQRFIPLYLVMCIIESAIDQLLMLGYDGPSRGAGGASGVIFGLMMIAMIWAPENCFEVAWGYRWGFGLYRSGTFEARISTFALYCLGSSLLIAWVEGFEMGTQVLHLIGAAVGAVAGILYVKQGWVDCEGWDLFSVWRGDHLQRSGTALPVGAWLTSSPEAPASRVEESPRRIARKIARLLRKRQFVAAWGLYRPQRRRGRIPPLNQRDLQDLIDGLVGLREWKGAASLIEELLSGRPDNPVPAQLALAGILTRELNRPRAALQILETVEKQAVQPSELALLRQIEALAKRKIEEGLLELSATAPE